MSYRAKCKKEGCTNTYHNCSSCGLNEHEELPYTYGLCDKCFNSTDGHKIWNEYFEKITDLEFERDDKIKVEVDKLLGKK